MDEPTSALDPESKAKVLMNWNHYLENKESTLFVVSHEPEVISKYIAFNKAIVFTNTGANLYTQQHLRKPQPIGAYSSFTHKNMAKIARETMSDDSVEEGSKLQERIEKLLRLRQG